MIWSSVATPATPSMSTETKTRMLTRSRYAERLVDILRAPAAGVVLQVIAVLDAVVPSRREVETTAAGSREPAVHRLDRGGHRVPSHDKAGAVECVSEQVELVTLAERHRGGVRVGEVLAGPLLDHRD